MTSFGSLVSVKTLDFDLPYEQVVNAFNDAGFVERYIPNPRQAQKAFKKALVNSTEGENFMIREIKAKGNTVVCGLVSEEKDKENPDLKYRVTNILTLDSASDSINGKTDFRTEAIRQSFSDFKKMIGSVEINLKIKDILFEAMAIEIMCCKAFFVPNAHVADVLKLQKLFKSLQLLGAEVFIDVLQVDGGTTTRNTIVNRFCEQTTEFLQQQIDACLDQRKKYEQGAIKYLRPKTFKNQLEKIAIVQERMSIYIPMLSMTPEEAATVIVRLEEADREINRNIDMCIPSRRSKKSKISLLDGLNG